MTTRKAFQLTTLDDDGALIEGTMGLTAHAIAILCGVDPAKVQAFALKRFDVAELPSAWRKAAARRCNEAFAGGAPSEDPIVAAAWWAEQYGEVEERGANFWHIPNGRWWEDE